MPECGRIYLELTVLTQKFLIKFNKKIHPENQNILPDSGSPNILRYPITDERKLFLLKIFKRLLECNTLKIHEFHTSPSGKLRNIIARQ